jgi:hypothetical protein
MLNTAKSHNSSLRMRSQRSTGLANGKDSTALPRAARHRKPCSTRARTSSDTTEAVAGLIGDLLKSTNCSRLVAEKGGRQAAIRWSLPISPGRVQHHTGPVMMITG